MFVQKTIELIKDGVKLYNAIQAYVLRAIELYHEIQKWFNYLRMVRITK